MIAEDPDMIPAWAEATGTPTSIGDVMQAAKTAAGVAKIPLMEAVRRILAAEREVAIKVASDWLSHRAVQAVNNLNIEGATLDVTFPIGLRTVMRLYPEVASMASTGQVDMLALRSIFPQWFRD